MFGNNSQPMDFFHSKCILAHLVLFTSGRFSHRLSGIHQFLLHSLMFFLVINNLPLQALHADPHNGLQFYLKEERKSGMERKMEEAVHTKTVMQPTGNKRLLRWQQVSLWLGDKARRVQWKNPHDRMSHCSLLSTS